MERLMLKGINLGSVLDIQETAILITDLEGVVLYMNKQAENIQYLAAQPLHIGSSLFESLPVERRELTRNMIRELVDSHESVSINVSYTDHQGKILYFDVKYSLLIDHRDGTLQILIEVNNVSHSKIFEKQITAVASELASLIENANAVIIGIDSQGYITEWNNKSAETTGYLKGEVLARRFLELIVIPEHRLYFEHSLQEVLSGELISNYELPIHSKDHRNHTFLINATPRKNILGQVIGILLMGQDITELAEYRASLEQKINDGIQALQQSLKKEKALVEVKNRFVAIASHEFKTPLSSIQFVTDFLMKYGHRLVQEDIHDKLENINKQVKLMTCLLDDVLLYEKSEAGKMQLIISRIDLPGFVKQIIEEVENTTKNTHTIDLDYEQTPGEIEVDEKLFRGILINLLTNAIKFSPGAKHVSLRLRGLPGKFMMTIKDDGIGIPEEEMEKIFEPFHRVKESASIKGTGLGLNIVKKSIELLKGTLQLESQIGKGTMFTITLPRDQNENG